ncbi:MAG TPA: radical SAM protein [Bacteroidota bacterium]|nr:radical SAM protein [Bacteroidota bacterium]
MIENKPHTLVINEIFHSIQGESSHAGRPCVFVRLTYCNIRCSYCDSEYSFYEGKEMRIEDILMQVRSYGCKLVEVTGGEPLFQTNVFEFLDALCTDGYEVLLETGGTLDIGKVNPNVKRIVDFKCPSSKMMKKNLWSIAGQLNERDEVKFVIGNREDYDWAKDRIAEHKLLDKCPVLMSVVFGELEPLPLAEWILADRLPVRFQLQMHKYIWEPSKRGV